MSLAARLADWTGFWRKPQVPRESAAEGVLHETRLERLRTEANDLCRRMQVGKPLPEDAADPEKVRLDGDPAWVPDMIAGRTMHEPDYAIFAKFTKSHGAILDIGANWGYSVGSIRASGSLSPILSFEVLKGFEPSLRSARDHLGKDYDYVMVGLAAKPAKISFMTPTVGSLALTALTTANWREFTDDNIRGIVTNMVNYARDYMPNETDLSPAFLRTEADVDTLDHALAAYKGPIAIKKIAAMKIDVEGLEADVLRGAEKTIKRHLPLLMLEGGNRIQAVDALTKKWGYELAEFNDGGLVLAKGYSKGANGFFVHPKKIATYKRDGILASV